MNIIYKDRQRSINHLHKNFFVRRVSTYASVHYLISVYTATALMLLEVLSSDGRCDRWSSVRENFPLIF